ncbi:hypothetical protein GGTG_05871 [Gaeumannomyces tritici R3-111a-1]|uniref:Vacuolar protein sorting-associated protein VTA1 n=1 Tax=Gaeumannomyces tritici (strain R3-111a-1) TaxID=644352 RepID=J3NX64_GAET3|nr:hypothetical protein GGTG_05871 [Gaeumannomyces tritici R3-111a-1]EJT75946.1 hypothetical protein GGTG_05871 [Gaeumannomyces tritici R3-111a-1]
MVLDPPPALKQADVNLFKCANRCNQLRAHKPIVAYWCDYWVVNQILAQGLHTADAEILTYTMTLMDKLEQAKAEQAHEVAVTDDEAGKAYMQQFSQETLDRAQKVVTANRVTGNTANTFDAAATFLNLMNIWGPADHETRQKIKYAKWSAVRILKAIKEGTDPNESNPRFDQAEEEAAEGTVDPDAERTSAASPGPRPVSVEEVADSNSKRNSAVISLPDTTPAVPSPLTREDMTLPDAPPESSSASQFYAQPGQQPGYFDTEGGAPPAMPSPMSPPLAPSAAPLEVQAWTPSPPPSANAPFAPPSPPAAGPPTFAPSSDATPAVAPPPISPPPSNYLDMTPNPTTARPVIPPPSGVSPTPIVPQVTRQYEAPVVAPVVVPAAASATGPPASGYITNDAAIAKAQKQARWAISALNFEDVPTAVKELRNALETLGAT